MKKLLLSLATAAALSVAAAVPVLAAVPDFPEQPGANVATACAAVTRGSGQGLAHAADPAVAITLALLQDACP